MNGLITAHMHTQKNGAFAHLQAARFRLCHCHRVEKSTLRNGMNKLFNNNMYICVFLISIAAQKHTQLHMAYNTMQQRSKVVQSFLIIFMYKSNSSILYLTDTV